MNKVLNHNNQAGAREFNAPRLVGDFLNEMLRSNSPLGIAYREHVAENSINPQNA